MLKRLQLTPRYGRLTGGASIGKTRAGIRLSASIISDSASTGSTVGTLSVVGGAGSYTYTLTSNPGTKFAISGSSLNTAAGLTAGSFPLTIHADNGSGSTFDLSVSITALPVAPTNSVAPAVSGGTSIGITLTSTKGTWSEDASNSYAYQWKRDGAPIGGQTATTYVTVSADDGHLVKCTVTATNATGSASADSNAVSVSSIAAPNAPTLGLASEVAGLITTTWDIDNTVAAGDTLTRQVATDVGFLTIIDTTAHTITSGEDTTNQITASQYQAPANGAYYVRGTVTSASTGLTSVASNILTVAVADMAASNLRIASTGNRRISSAGNFRKAS